MAIKILTSSITIATAFLAMPVLAGTQTWNLDDAILSCIAGNGCDSSSRHGNEINMMSGNTTLRMTAWSDTGKTDTEGEGVTTPYDGIIQSAKMVNYDSDPAHWGITNQDESSTGEYPGSPGHAVDNGSGTWADYDFFLLEFNEFVNLSHVSVDWSSGDSDISVAAFNNNPVPIAQASATTETTNDKTIAELLSESGAFFRKSIANVPDNGSYYGIGTDGIFSQSWLVSAYTPLIQAGLSDLNDAMKFSGWKTGTQMDPPGGVASPGSLALVLAGLLLMRGRERRQA